MLGVAQLPPAVRFQTDHRHASQPTASVARPAALSNGRRLKARLVGSDPDHSEWRWSVEFYNHR